MGRGKLHGMRGAAELTVADATALQIFVSQCRKNKTINACVGDLHAASDSSAIVRRRAVPSALCLAGVGRWPSCAVVLVFSIYLARNVALVAFGFTNLRLLLSASCSRSRNQLGRAREQHTSSSGGRP